MGNLLVEYPEYLEVFWDDYSTAVAILFVRCSLRLNMAGSNALWRLREHTYIMSSVKRYPI